MGATTAEVPSGSGSPGTPLDLAVTQPVVTVDGQTAAVAFAGLVPGGVGLFQINFVVPSGVGSGSWPLTVTQNGVATNTATLLVAAPH
jgi:uncharacterized protein (TIGR03437 family)